jgi:hypothetical protein
VTARNQEEREVLIQTSVCTLLLSCSGSLHTLHHGCHLPLLHIFVRLCSPGAVVVLNIIHILSLFTFASLVSDHLLLLPLTIQAQVHTLLRDCADRKCLTSTIASTFAMHACNCVAGTESSVSSAHNSASIQLVMADVNSSPDPVCSPPTECMLPCMCTS